MKKGTEVLFYAMLCVPSALLVLFVIIIVVCKFCRQNHPPLVADQEHRYYEIDDQVIFRVKSTAIGSKTDTSRAAITSRNSSESSSIYDKPYEDPSSDNYGYLNPYTGLTENWRVKQTEEYTAPMPL